MQKEQSESATDRVDVSGFEGMISVLITVFFPLKESFSGFRTFVMKVLLNGFIIKMKNC